MARRGEANTVKPIDRRTRRQATGGNGLGKGQRPFLAWLWMTEHTALKRTKAGSPEMRELLSQGFAFNRSEYLGVVHSPQQSDEVSRWLKVFIDRGLIIPFYSKRTKTAKGKHITHIRLTKAGKQAGSVYHFFGGCSLEELDVAVKFSSHWQRKELKWARQLIMYPPEWQGLRDRIYLRTLEAELADQVPMLEAGFLNYLMRLSPDRRGETIKLAYELRKAARRHEFTDGSPYPFYSTLWERDQLFVN